MKEQSKSNEPVSKQSLNKRLFSSNKKRIKFLELQVRELSELCKTLDPYKNIPSSQKVLLKKYNILNFNDPFTMTNQLLLLIEDSIEELEDLKQRTVV